MKKRSLFAAVAMLIVSAIVLTSATYAWFASGQTATVSTINAKVTNGDGTLEIAAVPSGTNMKWTNVLAISDFPTDTNVGVPGTSGTVANDATTLQPMSFDIATSTSSMMTGAISQDSTDATKYNFASGTGAPSGGYIKMTVYVRVTKACTVEITPTLTCAKAFVLGAVTTGDPTATPSTYSYQVVNGAGSATYTPVVGASKTAVDDTTKNGIVDAAEDTNGDILANHDVSVSSTKVRLTFGTNETTADNVYKQVDLFVWAEGQEPSCTGAVPLAYATFDVGFAII